MRASWLLGVFVAIFSSVLSLHVDAASPKWAFKAVGDVGQGGATLSDSLNVAFVGTNSNDQDIYLWFPNSDTTQRVVRASDIRNHFSPEFRSQHGSLGRHAIRIASNGDIYHAWLASRGSESGGNTRGRNTRGQPSRTNIRAGEGIYDSICFSRAVPCLGDPPQ